ncbi:MAG: helicase C-terminal domain-containing protein [Gammaproteobacteria bacterium]|nr:helicase C-terminal domain-containing protein [Gammaproteobacteria bacterium]
MISSAVDTRNYIVDFVKNELVGPDNYKLISKENKYAGYPAVQINGQEILKGHERPLEKYSAGVLFPSKTSLKDISNSDDTDILEASDLDQEKLKEHTEIKILGSRVDTDATDEIDREINLSNEFSPSAIGLSFLSDVSMGLVIEARAGYYSKRECKFDLLKAPELVWFRYQIDQKFEFSYDDLYSTHTEIINKEVLNSDKKETGLYLHVVTRPYMTSKSLRMITVSLINKNISLSKNKDEECFFQVGIKISNKNSIKCYPKNLSMMDEEQLALHLLYRHKESFAIGHGCAVNWNDTEQDFTSAVWTEIIPSVEIKPILPTEIKNTNLSMYSMAHGKDYEIFETCQTVVDSYKIWIDEKYNEIKQFALDPKLEEQAEKNLKNARICVDRIQKGIELLKNSSDVMKAFKWMNQTMYMQHAHYSMSVSNKREWIYKDNMHYLSDKYREPDYIDNDRSWRPFQLGFILMNLVSMNDPESEERDIVDLIWFPTGGGKTEAYLGLTSFTLFLRRLKNPDNSGTTVLMRYTLRLLTTQQFQRASSMICACEIIRREYSESLGREKFSIGLWVGGDVSPNTEKHAKIELTELEKGNTTSNKFVVTSCPWCGAEMGPVKKGNRTTCKGYLGKYRRGQEPTTRFICEDEDCAFTASKGGLPLAVIDEHIYSEPPSLLFSTVDKLAQFTFKPEASSIFGIDRNVTPPELIIQDELHLISGPLGSMVGHYEAIVDALCTELHPNKYKSKIVASTATISRANEQINALYARNGFLFPPQIIKAGDSFFAEEKTELDGRMYLGVMATAVNSHATSQIRTISALMQSVTMLDDVKSEYVDPYWTLVGYFNSIRELGHAATMISADIREFLNVLWSNRGIFYLKSLNNKHEYRRFINRYLELTSRMHSSDIPISLQELFAEYNSQEKNKAIDVCFATNMIQVGLDVSRLSLMTIIGQPKTTSEYIQASSRVGRELSKPGLVVTNFNPAKSRDRSHYEDFKNYHQSIYRYVEPTSVTPFSVPVRERALPALIVILVRYLYPQYRNSPAIVPNDDAQERIKKIILDRVNIIEEDEYESTLKMIDDFFEDWEISPPPRYGGYSLQEETPLVYPAGTEKLDDWLDRAIEVPSSMRSVDKTCEATMFFPNTDREE